MSNRKNYHSIVFLTTLSVYLGLVLVGAPPVLAQAALTQKIEIQNEAEIKDDLDKKPDEDLFVSSIVALVSEFNKFSAQKRFNWNSPFEYRIDDLRFQESRNSLSSAKSRFSKSVLSFDSGSFPKDFSIVDKIDETFVSFARNLFTEATNSELGSFYSHKLDLITLTLDDDKTLQIKAKFENGSGKNAQVFADVLTNYLAEIFSNSKATKEKVVAENTKITFENNQIFIVTRLPRASIDELLAQKDAQ